MRTDKRCCSAPTATRRGCCCAVTSLLRDCSAAFLPLLLLLEFSQPTSRDDNDRGNTTSAAPGAVRCVTALRSMCLFDSIGIGSI